MCPLLELIVLQHSNLFPLPLQRWMSFFFHLPHSTYVYVSLPQILYLETSGSASLIESRFNIVFSTGWCWSWCSCSAGCVSPSCGVKLKPAPWTWWPPAMAMSPWGGMCWCWCWLTYAVCWPCSLLSEYMGGGATWSWDGAFISPCRICLCWTLRRLLPIYYCGLVVLNWRDVCLEENCERLQIQHDI